MKKKIKILLLGGNSLIGNQLSNFLSQKNVSVFRTFKNIKKDKNKNFKFNPFKDFEKINYICKKTNPNFIINTIGITKHRKEINNFEQTMFLNSLFPHKLSEFCEKKKYRLIHFSTDCVFSGKEGNYNENSIPDSIDLYGVSKALGEIKDNLNCLTIRTSFIGYEQKYKKGFYEWVLSHENNSKRITGFKKAIYNGLTTLELSKIIYIIINKKHFFSGLYNVSSKKISKHDLIKIILGIYKIDLKIVENQSFFCDR